MDGALDGCCMRGCSNITVNALTVTTAQSAGPDGRWPDFPDALKHRVFMPIPTKHVGDELAKQWVKVPGTDMEIAVEPAEKRDDAVYVPNANLPSDCIELSPEV